jgi:ABC-type taurine transport system ATPase subunit
LPWLDSLDDEKSGRVEQKGGSDSPISPLSPAAPNGDLKIIGGSPHSLPSPVSYGNTNGGNTNVAPLLASPRGNVNGNVGNGRRFPKARISYVLQDEQLMPTQTVRETLSFSAVLRCPNHTSREISRRVNSVLSQLRLSHIADQFIGSPDTGGISGGERRRVTIGIELVTK